MSGPVVRRHRRVGCIPWGLPATRYRVAALLALGWLLTACPPAAGLGPVGVRDGGPARADSVLAGLPALFQFDLPAEPAAPPLSALSRAVGDSLSGGSAPHRPVGKLRSPSWRRRAAAAALVTAGGALAARWTRARADQAYERYLHAAGPKRRERALDRAERYDRLSGAGFLAMEAGIAACAYLVFF